jgi:hypothetical protein
MVYSGHGTARLDQVRFGGLAASCGGRGSVGSYKVRLVKVWRSGQVLVELGQARFVKAVVVRCALVRSVRHVGSRYGGHGAVRHGQSKLGTAVGVRQGCSGFGELCCGGRGTVR